jgi:divalent metal cation (Fe/Co/Zn/Cd) transporter
VPESVIELNQSYKLSIIISTIVLIGVTLARISWLYADALAAIVISIILTVCTIGLLKISSKTITDLMLLGKM